MHGCGYIRAQTPEGFRNVGSPLYMKVIAEDDLSSSRAPTPLIGLHNSHNYHGYGDTYITEYSRPSSACSSNANSRSNFAHLNPTTTKYTSLARSTPSRDSLCSRETAPTQTAITSRAKGHTQPAITSRVKGHASPMRPRSAVYPVGHATAALPARPSSAKGDGAPPSSAVSSTGLPPSAVARSRGNTGVVGAARPVSPARAASGLEHSTSQDADSSRSRREHSVERSPAPGGHARKVPSRGPSPGSNSLVKGQRGASPALHRGREASPARPLSAAGYGLRGASPSQRPASAMGLGKIETTNSTTTHNHHHQRSTTTGHTRSSHHRAPTPTPGRATHENSNNSNVDHHHYQGHRQHASAHAPAPSQPHDHHSHGGHQHAQQQQQQQQQQRQAANPRAATPARRPRTHGANHYSASDYCYPATTSDPSSRCASSLLTPNLSSTTTPSTVAATASPALVSLVRAGSVHYQPHGQMSCTGHMLPGQSRPVSAKRVRTDVCFGSAPAHDMSISTRRAFAHMHISSAKLR